MLTLSSWIAVSVHPTGSIQACPRPDQDRLPPLISSNILCSELVPLVMLLPYGTDGVNDNRIHLSIRMAMQADPRILDPLHSTQVY